MVQDKNRKPSEKNRNNRLFSNAIKNLCKRLKTSFVAFLPGLAPSSFATEVHNLCPLPPPPPPPPPAKIMKLATVLRHILVVETENAQIRHQKQKFKLVHPARAGKTTAMENDLNEKNYLTSFFSFSYLLHVSGLKMVKPT